MSIEAASQYQTIYREDGFCVVPQVLPPDVVRRAEEGMDALRRGEYDTGCEPMESPWKPGDDPDILCKIEMPHIASQAIFELVSHPALGEMAAAVTGAEMVQVWWVQLLYKPPGGKAGTNVGWHQDRQYWQVWKPGSQLFTAWVALSDVHEDCGPVRFVKGSHQWGFLDKGDFFSQSGEELKSQITIPNGRQWEEVPATMHAGGVSFHDCLTYHGSGPNLSDRPRKSFAIHMRTEKSWTIPAPDNAPQEHGRDLVQFLDNPVFSPIIYGV